MKNTISKNVLQEIIVYYAINVIPLRFYADDIKLESSTLTLIRDGAMIARFETYICWYVSGADKNGKVDGWLSIEV